MQHLVRISLATVALCSLIQPATALDVRSFGAIPDDGKDDTPAFLAAFQEAQAKGDKLIAIPKGRYHLKANGNPKAHGTLFPVNNTDGLTIDGQGAELMMSEQAAIFSFDGCKNITIRGLTLDWERPPFSQGTVVASTAKYFDLKVEDNYPVHGGEPVGAYMSYDPVSRLPAGRNMDVYGNAERTELMGPQVLRVHLKRDNLLPTGTLLVLRHQVYGINPFSFQRCTNVFVSDVTVYTAPGMALVGRLCTDVSLNHFNVMIRPGSGRLMSTTADATHFGGCKGTVSLEDCTFEGMGDDGVNVKSGLYLTITERVDDHTVLCRHNLKMVDVPDAGDAMELSHPDTLVPFSTNHVRAASLDASAQNLHRVEFAEALPDELRPGDVLGNASRVPKLRVRHCTVQANRARGVLCQTRDAIIENCTFRNCTGPGVLVLTETTHFFESIGTRNVTVRNNLFENCNQGAATAEAPLAALAWLKNSAYPPHPGVHRDVNFEGNRIIGSANCGIFAVAVDGLTLRGNFIQEACLKPDNENRQHVIRVMDCARVVIADNDIDPKKQGPGMKTPVLVTGVDGLKN